MPFQRSRTYPIPDKIFDQYNRANLTTAMGLFADLKHAWVSIDNALYLWDYTHPDPPLVGYEEQGSAIMAVGTAAPRPGVFVKEISRLLVVGTLAEIILIGMAIEDTPTGGKTIQLYKTGMAVGVKGTNVDRIAATEDGRIFFTGTIDHDVYEMTYQQEERWFYSRCARINHTGSRLTSVYNSFNFSMSKSPEVTKQMAVDDSRRLLYTLSTDSRIRVFHIQKGNGLRLVIDKPYRDILNNLGHMVPQTDLLSLAVNIVAIHPISAREAAKLHLVAVTSSGCRIFLSATTSFGYVVSDASSAPMHMQVHHVKFPPASDRAADRPQVSSTPGTPAVVNTHAKTLTTTRSATRYGTGSSLFLIAKASAPTADELFVAAPDVGRIARPQDPSTMTRYPELGFWLTLGGVAEAVGLVSSPPPASATRDGYANELATQFEAPALEVAVLTNSGVYTLRRQRLVDIFANAVRTGKADSDATEGGVKRFLRLYGRVETAATALAVACGQGVERGSGNRLATLVDPHTTEQARNTFIEYGGKATVNENLLVDSGAVPTVDMVRPSPRCDGLALYLSRLIRSFWKSRVVQERPDAPVGEKITPATGAGKLQDVQQDLVRLKEFLVANKSFIEGLGGPDALGKVATKQQEVCLLGEHRAMHALVKLVDHIIEGVSFVQMLFGERLDDLLASLSEEVQKQVKALTYESLFAQPAGKGVAKDLVKAIVNRNIQNGANVETVADALRRRCGTFCSPSDVVIFKSQELVKRAAEAGATSELSRNLLNDSLKLFKSVAADLTSDQVQTAVQQYINMSFFGGAIELALKVAEEQDRGNRALVWIQMGRPENVCPCAITDATCFMLIDPGPGRRRLRQAETLLHPHPRRHRRPRRREPAPRRHGARAHSRQKTTPGSLRGHRQVRGPGLPDGPVRLVPGARAG